MNLLSESGNSMMRNLKHNWFFPISAFFFFVLNSWNSVEYLVGVLFAFVCMIVFSLKCDRLSDVFKKTPIFVRIFALFNSLGICIFDHDLFCKFWSDNNSITYDSASPFPFLSFENASLIGGIGCLLSLYFVYFASLFFYNKIIKIFKENSVFEDISKSEIAVYMILLVLTLCFATYAFLNSQIFYGTDCTYDVLYTSDSPILVELNTYLNLTHMENDLRQPLFAVFSSPLLGFTYLFGFPFSYSVRALILDCAQIILLIFSNYLLAKINRLSGVRRVCFVVLFSSTYTYLLFSLMMEQYIVAYLYLMLCIYIHLNNKKIDLFSLYASAGTLLTGSVIIPFVLWKEHSGNFKMWIKSLFRSFVDFSVLIIAFGRFDIFYSLLEKIKTLGVYTGDKASLNDRILQYIVFVRSCFVTPPNKIFITSEGDMLWRLSIIDYIDLIGIFVFFLAGIGFMFNRKNTNSKVFFLWMIFSILILVVMGWGTQENGLTLYILYFGWAFYSLIFQLFKYFEERFLLKHLLPIVSVFMTIVFLIINFTEMTVLLEFGITFYPV